MTALVLEQERGNDPDSTRCILEKSLNFDSTFPEFGTKNGVLPAEPGIAHTPPQLWVKALERILEILRKEKIPLERIAGIGVSGQQHGSVYLNGSTLKTLSTLDPKRELADQVEGIYSRKTSPIWMDASTSEECREITQALGGDAAVCQLTGSRCFERFTGPQIRKFFKTQPKEYADTRHILLVSSFIPTLLSGKIIGIDPGDGAGMSLMDISQRRWSGKALAATAPDLDLKLETILPSDAVAGAVSPYFAERFGFSRDCRIMPGTGDNPASLVGLGLISSGRIAVSLGTSDVLFAFMNEPKIDPSGNSHVFGNPTGAYMALCVYKNGSLAREAVCQKHHLSWEQFSEILRRTPPGNNGRIMLPYFDTEIIPRIGKPGVERYGFDTSDAEAEVRAVVEAQMASMCLHGAWMGEKPRRIQATGGASNNREILQVMANMFGVPVLRQESSASAALGAAIRAQHGVLKAGGGETTFEELTRPHVKASFTVEPDMKAHLIYRDFLDTYGQKETAYVKTLG